ncbi:MAG TPA: lipid IV(A) 3-deoxy-D-manno-octulosonic acid transferase [Casimicrobiaceae bacterium]|nr:lipid IV(A) 3-deoxy-D-manno-octulosonic acid transferase [Casimicrobiaceae bacterium]
MPRTLYTLLWYAASPLIPIRLWYRGRREPLYRVAIGERFGVYRTRLEHRHAGTIWIHAVSLGETRAVAPLIERIVRERPDVGIVLTAMTASGREAGRALYGDRVMQAWLPYDLPFAIDAFLDRYKPSIGLLMETELWPNLVAACARRGVPLHLVNARMSARSAAGYAKFGAVTRSMLASLAGVIAQTDDDARRLRDLGAEDVAVVGNLKFDVAVPEDMRARGAALRERLGRDRQVWLAASTREGEEVLLLDTIARAPRSSALLLLVPRHPQRFDDVERLLRQRGLEHVRKSSGEPVGASTQVVLGDTMGEMFAYCAAADLAFVGGSLVPLGGQNLIEPIAVGVPALVGPHTFNFADATERAIDAGAAMRIADAESLLAAVASLLGDANARERMRSAALGFVAQHQGAAERTWQRIEPALAKSLAPR